MGKMDYSRIRPPVVDRTQAQMQDWSRGDVVSRAVVVVPKHVGRKIVVVAGQEHSLVACPVCNGYVKQERFEQKRNCCYGCAVKEARKKEKHPRRGGRKRRPQWDVKKQKKPQAVVRWGKTFTDENHLANFIRWCMDRRIDPAEYARRGL